MSRSDRLEQALGWCARRRRAAGTPGRRRQEPAPSQPLRAHGASELALDPVRGRNRADGLPRRKARHSALPSIGTTRNQCSTTASAISEPSIANRRDLESARAAAARRHKQQRGAHRSHSHRRRKERVHRSARHVAREKREMTRQHLGSEIGNAEEQVELGARVHQPQNDVGPERDPVRLAICQSGQRDGAEDRGELVIDARGDRLNEARQRARARSAGALFGPVTKPV